MIELHKLQVIICTAITSTPRLHALLILTNLVRLKMIGYDQLIWLYQYIMEIPDLWSMNDYALALPLLRDAGFDMHELTLDVFKKVRGKERQAVTEWIVSNAEGMGFRVHINLVPLTTPQLT